LSHNSSLEVSYFDKVQISLFFTALASGITSEKASSFVPGLASKSYMTLVLIFRLLGLSS
jgi:hypothetical protein